MTKRNKISLAHPRWTKKFDGAIRELLYMPDAESIAGKVVLTLGDPVYLAEIVRRLASMPLWESLGVIAAGGPSPAYQRVDFRTNADGDEVMSRRKPAPKYWAEYLGAHLLSSIVRHDVDGVGFWKSLLAPLSNKTLRHDMECVPESVWVISHFSHMHYELMADMRRKGAGFSVETASRDTYDNFANVKRRGLYRGMSSGRCAPMVVVCADEAKKRAYLTARTVFEWQFPVEFAPYRSRLAFGEDGRFTEFGKSRAWREARAIITCGDWPEGDPNVEKKIVLDGATQYMALRVLEECR